MICRNIEIMTEDGRVSRKANSIAEIELLLTIALLHKKVYYQSRPIMHFLSKIGLGSSKVTQHCTDEAMIELTDVNYVYDRWVERYGEGMLNFE